MRDAGWWRRFSRGAGVRTGGRRRSSPTRTPITSAVFPRVLRTVRARAGGRTGDPVPRSAYLGVPGPRWTEQGIAWHPGRAGERFRLDGVTFTILHPGRHVDAVGRGHQRGLAGSPGGVRRASRRCSPATPAFPRRKSLGGQLGPVDLLKVGHHGSRGSTGVELARAASAARRGHLGRAERLRSPGAGDAGSPGRGRSGGAPDRPRWNDVT